MRRAGNFNPEWGYLAPAPSFMRTARIVIVSAAVGATAGTAVVFSLVDRPAAEESVAARTLAQPVAAASTPISLPAAAQRASADARTEAITAAASAGGRAERFARALRDAVTGERPRGKSCGKRIEHQFDSSGPGEHGSAGRGPGGDRCRAGASA